ncbi:hypothetical protein [Microvirga arsenatis]|uniref:GNAT family N-acetyltransferase n=1 Tax=Microvirga arsenatis TaxID=2692265 RepID=A0ABW9YV49_9HYPH|nr:hypothetical protein [Microvirga arsenatis]NBJ12947.1 hypothetical protein [Microvirga arsenatis]NBJ23923.1 hypothetical protein [Microvirga arsenatis]
MNELATLAARNNALWCDAVCRADGRPGEFRDDLWLNRHGTPRFYPDAVTLTGHPGLADVVASLVGTDPGRGWAVKDSFAAIDLSPLGFQPLFDAQWLFLEPPAAGSVPEEVAVVENARDLTAWSHAWSGPGASPEPCPFGTALLSDPDIVFASFRQDRSIVAGGILNRGGGAVGLSNLFAPADRIDAVWRGMAALAARRFPGLPLVGYEREAEREAATRNGFVPVGDLRIWHRPGG